MGDDRLPPAVIALARRLGAVERRLGGDVRLRQAGRMRQGAGSPWMAFTAQQVIATDDCRFAWKAKAGPAGLLRVTDALDATGGFLRASLFGLIVVAEARGNPAVARGELMRYLAELAWAPEAILGNPRLRWRVESPERLVVSADIGTDAAQVTLWLDQEGRIASAFAADRPRAIGKRFVPTPWRGRFMDYRAHQGRVLPFRGQVEWVETGGDVVCWEGELTDWQLAVASDPPARSRGART